MNINWNNVKELTIGGKSVKKLELDGVTVWEKAKPKFYDYLQGDGVAYIITDYIPNDTSGIFVIANCVAASGNHQVVGVRQSSTGDNRWWVNFSSSLEIAWNTWKTTNISKSEYLNKWVTVENNYLNSRLGKVDGITKRTEYPTLVNITYPAYIFVGNSGGSPFSGGTFTGKIKNIKFSEGTTIVRDFVPCEYKGEYGLWDLVHNKFYGNANSSGTFIVGNEIKYYDYLQTDGNSWIDTDMQGHMNYTYELSYQQINTSAVRNWGVFGQSSYVGYNMSLTYGSNNWMVRWNCTSDGQQNISLPIIDTNRHLLRIENGLVTFDGVNKGTSTGHSSSLVIPYNIYLGTINPANTTPTANGKTKFYYYKVWDNNGILIRDYKPCLYNGVAGLWDSVECKFYGNANNTGTLTVGNDG